MDPVDRPVVEAGDAERAPVAGPFAEHVHGVLRMGSVGPRHLRHVAVVAWLLEPDAVGAPPHPPRPLPPPELLAEPHQTRGVGRVEVGDRRIAAHEADEGHPCLLRGLDRQRRRRAHRDDRAEAGGPRLLHDLEPGPTAHVEAQLGGREPAVEQEPADDLVDGVVAADVLPHQERSTGAVEGGRGVHRTGRREEVLARVHEHRHLGEEARSDHGAPTGIGAIRSRSSSIAVDPHNPHAVLVAASRAVGVGAVPPVSTLTTLNSLSTALPVPQ